MVENESKGGGDSGKQRAQVRSSVPVGQAVATTAESTRGDTTVRSRNGPTELPPQFGRYRVKKKLGGGGMGTVYLVENTELEREEALKVPHFSDFDGDTVSWSEQTAKNPQVHFRRQGKLTAEEITFNFQGRRNFTKGDGKVQRE